MLIGILSDSHDNEPNLIKALKHCVANSAEMILHCGDICSPDTLELMARTCALPIHVVFGNGDYDRDKLTTLAKTYSHLTVHGDEGSLEIDGINIGWCHYPGQADEMAATRKFDAVFYGHTHVPWEKKIGDCMVRNPGTIAGTRNKATFAIFDTATNAARLIVLEKI